jgi:hypothetical protein
MRERMMRLALGMVEERDMRMVVRRLLQISRAGSTVCMII